MHTVYNRIYKYHGGIMGNMIEINSDIKNTGAYEALPKAEPKGAVIVIHEVWGLADHIKSIADRFANEGYVALAPNLLDSINASSEEIAQLQKDLFDDQKRSLVQPQLRKLMAPIQEPEFGKLTTDRLKDCFNYLYSRPEAKQKIAVTGFCFGGTYSFSLAVAEPRLILALPFYGHADQAVEELKSIKCPIRAFFGQNDEALISKLPDLESRMSEAGIDFKAKVYQGCGHAFFNDTNPITYNEVAAQDSWQIVLSELQKTTE